MARPRQFEEEHVLDAVMNVFWQRGYEATSAQDVVNATGLARSSLYNAFSDKHTLYEQALLQYNKHTAQNIRLLNQPGLVRNRIRELLTSIVDPDSSDSSKRGCFATNSAIELAGHDAPVATLVQQNFASLEAALKQAIHKGQQTGEIARGNDASALAHFILNTIQGLRVLGKVTPKSQRKRLMDIVNMTLEMVS